MSVGQSDRSQEIEDLRDALQWALAFIGHATTDEPEPGDGEVYENYSGATRLAWPDQPENWA